MIKQKTIEELQKSNAHIAIYIVGDTIHEDIDLSDDAERREFIDALGSLQAKLRRIKGSK